MDPTLHWCQEDFPSESNYFTFHSQSLQDPLLLSCLKHEAEIFVNLPKNVHFTFDLKRLQNMTLCMKTFTIVNNKNKELDVEWIEEQLLQYSQYLLFPYQSFVYLTENFDCCGNENIYDYGINNESIPLFCGISINKSLTIAIEEIMRHYSLQSLTICEDILRFGQSLQVLPLNRFHTLPFNFVVRAIVG